MTLFFVGLGAFSLVLFASGLPGFAPRGPGRRITPYLASERRQSLGAGREAPWDSFLERLSRDSSEVVGHRLRSAGSGKSVTRFRLERLVWGAILGVSVVLGLAVLQASSGRLSPGPALLAGLLSAALGWSARDKALDLSIARRGRALVSELPSTLDMLAIAVTAGESINGALKRVARLLEGTVTGEELDHVLADIRSGTSTMLALETLARNSRDYRLQRFARAVALAIENGTPLAAVLNGQAADAREAERRALLEIGAKREIWMLIPVVFLLLPTVVLLVFYPSVVALDMFVP